MGCSLSVNNPSTSFEGHQIMLNLDLHIDILIYLSLHYIIVMFCLYGPGLWSQRAVTPYVLKAAVAVEHTLLLGLYDIQADPSPLHPSLAVLPLQLHDGHPQV